MLQLNMDFQLKKPHTFVFAYFLFLFWSFHCFTKENFSSSSLIGSSFPFVSTTTFTGASSPAENDH